MATRNLRNYFGVNTRSVHANNRFATDAKEKGVLPVAEKKTVAHNLQDFFTNNVLAWFFHDWRVKKPYTYPTKIGQESIHDIREANSTIALAADWGSDTPQAEYIGQKMFEKSPDYTVHLGDIYYSGIDTELKSNYGTGNGDWGIWPRGKAGSFALAGNHEMFSGGQDYYNMIRDPKRGFGVVNKTSGGYSGQAAPVFCLRTEHWCILGLDTGYPSLRTGILRLHPDNLDLQFSDAVMEWLDNEVKLKEEKRGIVVLTHHQYMSAFNGEDEFSGPAKQLEALLPGREMIWIWGHEHRFSMYGRYKKSNSHIAAFGRCIGNGGMPDEHSKKRFLLDNKAKEYGLVLYDKRTADTIELSRNEEGTIVWTEDIGYNGYAMMQLKGEQLAIRYFESYGGIADKTKEKDEKVVEETWRADNKTGKIACVDVVDFTKEKSPVQQLSYAGAPNARRAGGIGTVSLVQPV